MDFFAVTSSSAVNQDTGKWCDNSNIRFQYAVINKYGLEKKDFSDCCNDCVKLKWMLDTWIFVRQFAISVQAVIPRVSGDRFYVINNNNNNNLYFLKVTQLLCHYKHILDMAFNKKYKFNKQV
mgnify:CR=1 FL=1